MRGWDQAGTGAGAITKEHFLPFQNWLNRWPWTRAVLTFQVLVRQVVASQARATWPT